MKITEFGGLQVSIQLDQTVGAGYFDSEFQVFSGSEASRLGNKTCEPQNI